MQLLRIGALLLLGATSCARNDKPALTLAGSTSVQPFAEKWAEAFRAKKGVEIHVQGGGSTAGVQAALAGAAQLGMVSRELKAEEKAQLEEVVVARDGIAVIVNKANPLTDISLETLSKIYSGQLATWTDAGGNGGKITVITREDGSGTRGAFEELAMKGAKIAPSALVQDSTGAARQMVSSDPSAIGYISLGQIDDTVKVLEIGGVKATEAEIDAGKYPLVRPFLFVRKKDAPPQVMDLIAWITGPEGQELTRKEGLLPPRKP